MAWLSHRELVALGWTLLHFLWQGAAIAILYSILNRLTLQARPAVRYGVALGALALMPLSVAVTLALETHAAQAPAILSTASPDTPQGYAQAVFRNTVLTQLPASLESIGKERAPAFLNAETLLPWVDAIWMLGVLLLATRALFGWLRLQRIRRNTHSILPAEVERSFERIKRQLAIHQQVLLRVSDQVITPFAMGLWRATVVLPISTLMNLSPEELEAVFAHELGHIRRFDYLCNLVQIAIESALFFHPAVWWISRTVRDRREVCCDEIAVTTCANAIVYARALLHLEEQRTTHLQLATALNGRPGTLRQRYQTRRSFTNPNAILPPRSDRPHSTHPKTFPPNPLPAPTVINPHNTVTNPPPTVKDLPISVKNPTHNVTRQNAFPPKPHPSAAPTPFFHNQDQRQLH